MNTLAHSALDLEPESTISVGSKSILNQIDTKIPILIWAVVLNLKHQQFKSRLLLMAIWMPGVSRANVYNLHDEPRAHEQQCESYIQMGRHLEKDCYFQIDQMCSCWAIK